MHYIVLQTQFGMITSLHVSFKNTKNAAYKVHIIKFKMKNFDYFLLSEQSAALLFIQWTTFVVSSRQKPVADCFCIQKRCSCEEGDALPSEDLFI